MTDITNLYSVGSQLFIPVFAEVLEETNNYFTVLDIIKGGMGGCLKISSNSGKVFGLKIILPDNFTDKVSYERYLNELKNWITFSMCDGVLDAYRIFDLNGIPCVISPWMEKGDLYSLMKIKERTVFYNSIHRIIGSLKWVMDNYNTIHRDLKPANILVDSNYLPYVGDWGLAKKIGDKDTEAIQNNNSFGTGITQQGSFLGTYPYASPEQLLDSTSIDQRSDIFAVGVIMYEWIAGNRPFVGSSLNELTNNILSGKFKRFDWTFNPLNFGIEKIINKCLELNPDNRFSSYQELLVAIEESATDVTSFVKYVPIIKDYRDLLNPKTINERIQSNEIEGVVSERSKGAVIFTEEEHIWEQLEIACNIGETGNYKKTIGLLYKILPQEYLVRKFPDLPIHQSIIINLSYFLNKIDQNIESEKLLLLIEHASNLPIAYYTNLSNNYIHQKKYHESLEISKNGLKKYTNDPDLLGNACLAATLLNDFDEANSYGKKRIDMNPCLRSFKEYGFMLLKYGDSLKETNFPEAIKMYKSALLWTRKAKEYNPKHYETNQNEAIILFKLRRYADSSRILCGLECYESTPYWLAKNMLWRGSTDECIKFCDKYIKEFPNSIVLKRVRAECMVDNFVIGHLYEKKKFIEDTSWEFFSTILNDNENRKPSDLRYYGRMLNWLDDVKTLDFFDWAKTIFPNEWTFPFHKAYALINYKRYEDALKEALNAKKLAPWREKVYELLSKCYSYLEEYEKAGENLKKSKEIASEKEKLYNTCKTI